MYEHGESPDPIIGNWYRRLDNPDEFEVVSVDDDTGTVEVQFFNGDVSGYTQDEWDTFELELIEPPEDWTGALEPVDDSEALEPVSQPRLRAGFEEEDVLLIEDEADRQAGHPGEL